MNQVIICSPNIKKMFPEDDSIKSIDIEGISVTCALVETPDKMLDMQSKENEFLVLIKKRAFSCNYRDKAILLGDANKFNDNVEGNQIDLRAIGSDFVADVIAVGNGVKGLKIGDRVIGDAHYPSDWSDIPHGYEYKNYKIGMPTNDASKGLEILHYKKLIKIPKLMKDEVAASFMTGAITAYSIIRKLKIKKNDTILITAVKSNTSLFVLNALKKIKHEKRIKIFALSRSEKYQDELKKMGVDKVLQIDPNSPILFDKKHGNDIHSGEIKFNCVIDPFFDLHFTKVVRFMDFGGRYITCGFHDQFSSVTKSFPLSLEKGPEFSHAFTLSILLNALVIGNCIGLTSDLKRAINDHAKGKFDVPIDSVFEGSQVAEFLERTYNDPDRFGKVVYKFSD